MPTSPIVSISLFMMSTPWSPPYSIRTAFCPSIRYFT